MHPEHLNVAISAAAAGDKVAIFTENLRLAEVMARDFEDEVPREYIEKISRTNGRGSIHFHGGGSIRFISVNQSARGLSLDRVFVPIGTDRDTQAAIIPALSTSQSGVLTGY